MVGKRFGRLTVLKQIDDYVAPSGGVHKRFLCICDCGTETIAVKDALTSGKKKSCGCLKKENGVFIHGEIKTRLYRIWGNMCNRCTNPGNPVWNRYGGRGITVCEEWLNYENFRDWARANGYADGLTIDRIDNDNGYRPSNCRWVDAYTQANNKRNNHLVEYNGETKTIAEWAVCIGIPYKVLHRRIKSLGWTVEKAFNQPIRRSPVSQKAKQQDG